MRTRDKLRGILGRLLVDLGMLLIPEDENADESKPKIDFMGDDDPEGDMPWPPVQLNDEARSMLADGMSHGASRRVVQRTEEPLEGSREWRVMQARRAAGME